MAHRSGRGGTSSSASASVGAEAVLADSEDTEPVGNKRMFKFSSAIELDKILAKRLRVTDKEQQAWTNVKPDIRVQCVKTLVRLFLLKGGRRDSVTRPHVLLSLAALDSVFKKYANAALAEAQVVLRDVFGFLLIPADHFLIANSKRDELFLINELESSRFHEILSSVSSESTAAFAGFCFVVLHCVWSSPGKKITAEALLRKVRMVDRRFPETDEARKGVRGHAALNEIGERNTFSELIDRMKKESYLVTEREDYGVDADTANKVYFLLGPRFFSEVGKRRLLLSYQGLAGTELNERLVRQLDNEECLLSSTGEDEQLGLAEQVAP